MDINSIQSTQQLSRYVYYLYYWQHFCTSIIDFNTIYTRYNIQVFISLLKRLMYYLCKVDFFKIAWRKILQMS